MQDTIVKRVIVTFIVALIVLVGVALTAIRNINRAIASSDWVNHTHAVMSEAQAILSSLHAGDAAVRSYLLSNDPRDQSAYRDAYSEMTEHLEVAKALTRNEPAQEKIFQLESLVAKHVESARELVKSRQQQPENVRANLAATASGELLNGIARVIGKLQDEEKTLLEQRDKASYIQAQTTYWTVLAGVGINFVLLGFVAWLVKDDIGARRLAARALQEANLQLEAKVQERTAQLASSNNALKKENLERQWSNQALEHQLRYSQLIINSIHDLIFVVTKSLNISRINPAVVHLTGLDSTELITNPLSKFVHITDESDVSSLPKNDILAQALKEGRDLQDCTAMLLSKDGQKIPFHLNLFPLRDKDKVVGGVVTLHSTQPPGLPITLETSNRTASKTPDIGL